LPQAATRRFYGLLDVLAAKHGGPRTLGEASEQLTWPRRGVYFFFEPGEARSGSGEGRRVVRVGTHALKAGSQSSLWGRLSQHRGSPSGGNHRGSVFRLFVGLALQSRDPSLAIPSWAKGSSAPADVLEAERSLEAMVSATLAQMQVVWLPVGDEPGPDSLRGYIERNSIALLSAYASPATDPPSAQWLGRHCPRERVRKSGLWNSNHVDEVVDADFLDAFARLIAGDLGAPSPTPLASTFVTPFAIAKGGNAERIIEALRQYPDLDDDELSHRAGVFPRQQVNIVCRRLEQQGVVRRFTGVRGKIVSRLTGVPRRGNLTTQTGVDTRPRISVGRDAGREKDRSQIIPRLDDSSVPTLVIIPCSGRKASGSRRVIGGETLWDALPVELAARLQSARRIVAPSAGLDETTLMPAWLRNAGTLYQNAFGADADAETGPPFRHLLILSGAYGVVQATDPIGTYNMVLKEGLWPPGLLAEVIEAYARVHEIRRAVALACETTDYAKVIRRVDWARAGVADAVLLSPEVAGGAMFKAPRAIGEAFRVLSANDLSASWRSADGLRMFAHRLA
jgi:hypothetical protein